MNKKKFLIVNADDMGRTVDINKGIEQGYKRGIISSASLVANSLAFNHALKIIKRNPGLKIGVHLNLHEYKPMLKTHFLIKLSKLNHLSLYLRLLLATANEIREIEKNFLFQINKIQKFGIRISHLDGHNHMHIHPRLNGVMLKILKKKRINKIRLPDENIYKKSSITKKIKVLVLKLACIIFKKKIPNIITTANFHGLADGGYLNVNALIKIIKNEIKEGTNELMCHVGLKNSDPPYNIDYNWKTELNAIIKYKKKYLLKKFNIKIITFNQID
tara:strand:+ start:11031 stop:11852 length:822 start_codon:yes stop_codon:yes gene_type:complete